MGVRSSGKSYKTAGGRVIKCKIKFKCENLKIMGDQMYFDHEKLIVYQRSLEFIEFAEPILQRFKYRIPIIEHLDEASTSISLNIAEGTGKLTPKDKCKFFDISRGSALECASSLDILLRKKKISEEEMTNGQKLLLETVSM
jgi:four helix bundle protein